MNDADRVSIHEAMEQQSISISKAGIVTTLQARCAVLAAANPRTGRYDATRTFAENVDLTDPILQRFDILCVLQDRIDPIEDERLARTLYRSPVYRRVCGSEPCGVSSSECGEANGGRIEDGSGGNSAGRPINKADSAESAQEIYPIRACQHTSAHRQRGSRQDRQHVAVGSELNDSYAEIRRESVGAGGIPVAIRHIESIIRMAEAHARMHLR